MALRLPSKGIWSRMPALHRDFDCLTFHLMSDGMSDGPGSTPEMDGAVRRLEAAIDRLEGRLDGLFERLEGHRTRDREADALRVDRTRLAGDLDAARARERELQRLADEASEALGAAISEVREALGKV
jgi:hypothetical protein